MKNKSSILTIILALVAVAAIVFAVVTNGQKASIETDLNKQIDDLKAQVETLKADLSSAQEAQKTAQSEAEEAAKAAEEANKAA